VWGDLGAIYVGGIMLYFYHFYVNGIMLSFGNSNMSTSSCFKIIDLGAIYYKHNFYICGTKIFFVVVLFQCLDC